MGDGLFSSELQFVPPEGERLYGMGENAVDAPNKVNLKGCTIDLFQRMMQCVVPFVVSSEGYGFLWNNPSLGNRFEATRPAMALRGCRNVHAEGNRQDGGKPEIQADGGCEASTLDLPDAR